MIMLHNTLFLKKVNNKYDSSFTEASEYKRLKVAEHEYKFRVSVQKELHGTEAKITKDFQSILDYIQKQLKVTAK